MLVKKKMRRNPKYHAVRTKVDNFSFDSKMEASRYAFHKLRLKAGEIAHLDVHPVVTLPGGIRWTLDFCVWVERRWFMATTEDDMVILDCYFEDVKGFETEAFKLKRKLFNATHPAAPLRVVKLKGKQWVEL